MPIEKIMNSLKMYYIPYRVRICSAHKQANKLMKIIKEYNDLAGLIAYVAIAGGTDALSGTLSFHALAPVITCPPDTRYANKEKYTNEINPSCLRNPPGSCNAYISRPDNVGKFLAQMFSPFNSIAKNKLINENKNKIKNLEKEDKSFFNSYQPKY